MDTEKNKPILIGVAVVCLIGAGVVAYLNFGGGGGSGPSNEPIPMLCTACGNGFDVTVKEYQDMMAQFGGDMMMGPMQTLQLPCPKCSKKAAITAIKCKGCSTYYAPDYVRNPELKCPKCGQAGY